MNMLTKLPNWAVEVFSLLCFQQVKDQLSETIVYQRPNPASFICNGQLYAFAHNQAFITDEPHGSFINYRHSNN